MSHDKVQAPDRLFQNTWRLTHRFSWIANSLQRGVAVWGFILCGHKQPFKRWLTWSACSSAAGSYSICTCIAEDDTGKCPQLGLFAMCQFRLGWKWVTLATCSKNSSLCNLHALKECKGWAGFLKSTALRLFWLFPIFLYKFLWKFSLAGDKYRHLWTSVKFIILRKKISAIIMTVEKPVQQSLVPLLVVISWRKTLKLWKWWGKKNLTTSFPSFPQEKLQGKCPFIAVIWSQSFLALSSFLAMQGVNWSFRCDMDR